MVLETPLWSTGPSGAEIEHSAILDRRLIEATFREDGGVFRHITDNALLASERAAGPNMSVDIAAGMCVVPGTAISNQGSYICRSTAVENRTVASAPASGTRTDLVIARVYDSEVSGTEDKFDIEVLNGTTTLPDNAIALARVAVPSGSASVTDDMITDVRENASLAQSMPSGSMTMTGAQTAPSGWLLCQGQAISRAEFAQLFDAIGTTYGSGDGSTTFNVPDMRARFPVGAGTGHTLGAKGGNQSVSLTTAQMPSHNHSSAGSHVHGGQGHQHSNPNVNSNGGHRHTIRMFRYGQALTHNHNDEGSHSSTGTTTVDHRTEVISSSPIASNGSHSHSQNNTGTGNLSMNSGGSHTHSSNGSGSSHENRPPFSVVNFIIKT